MLHGRLEIEKQHYRKKVSRLEINRLGTIKWTESSIDGAKKEGLE